MFCDYQEIASMHYSNSLGLGFFVSYLKIDHIYVTNGFIIQNIREWTECDEWIYNTECDEWIYNKNRP